ncbi:MAG: hypothetical protein JRE14_00180 [Deltaproteobacteria bacterium]|nr:hypothetical protein [Deltaproteobacteria bacterium]
MTVTFAFYLGTHFIILIKRREVVWKLPKWVFDRYVYLMGAVFILGMDYWAWEKAQPLIAGVPAWIGFFVLLSLVQTVGMVYMVRKKNDE